MKEEILQYNSRCAEFLGWKETSEQFKIDWVGCKTKERLEKINKNHVPILEKNGDVIFPDFAIMNFTNDWNWIMEVVTKIQLLDIVHDNTRSYDSVFKEYQCTFSPQYKTHDFGYIVGKSKTSEKEAVIEAINQFLIWYNKNK